MIANAPSQDPRVVSVQDKDQLWITLDDPLTKNALDLPLVQALASAVERSTSKIVVITGKNGAFSSGGGLATVAALSEQAKSDVGAVEATIRLGGNLIEDLLVSSATTIALIDGACAGAGLGIALACDYRIATHRSRFTTAYSKLGLPSDFGTHELLRRRIGDEIADQLMKSSDTIGITKAMEWGLIDALTERVDRKGVKKALKGLPKPNRKSVMSGMSSVLDSEAATFALALTRPKTQIKLEKAIRKLQK